MSRDYVTALRKEARQRARVRYIEDKAHTLVPLTFSHTQRWDDALAMAVDLAGRLFDKLPEMPTEEDAAPGLSPALADTPCPKCGSPDPARRATVDTGAEVYLCSHAFHGAEQ